MGESNVSVYVTKCGKFIKPFLLLLAVIVVCLSIAGLAQDDPDGPGLFVGVLVLTLIGLLATLTYKLLKSHGRSTYQINEEEGGKDGVDNKGFNKEQEKGGVSEKEGVNINAEVDNKEAEDNKKWKDNYVPYEEPK